MIAGEVLETVMARIADSSDGVVYITEAELARWPAAPVSVLKANGLLIAASPARSVTCDGCESQCSMPVEVIDYLRGKAAFIFCDKRDDVDRIEVPFDRLRRWQASGEAVAAFLAAALQMRRTKAATTDQKRWPVGILYDKRAAHLDLEGDKTLALKLAGWEVPLADVLKLKGKKLALDRQRLVECVNYPVAGGGTPESAAKRRQRIAARCKELYEQGERRFRKIVAAEEGRSVETIKDILAKAGFSTRGLLRPNK